jgi:multiple antibiotic resistance protein
MVGPAEIFTLFFVTLGPLKILGPFVQRTRDLDEAEMRKVALLAFLLATVAIVLGSFIGRALLAKWTVSLGALVIAAGIVFLLVALKQLLEVYEPEHPSLQPAAPVQGQRASPMAVAMRLLFPTVLTPYGIAAVIALLAASQETQRTEIIVGLVIGVMVLNLIGMLLARRILVGFAMMALQVLGAVLAVLQAALAVQFVLDGLKLVGVLRG